MIHSVLPFLTLIKQTYIYIGGLAPCLLQEKLTSLQGNAVKQLVVCGDVFHLRFTPPEASALGMALRELRGVQARTCGGHVWRKHMTQ